MAGRSEAEGVQIRYEDLNESRADCAVRAANRIMADDMVDGKEDEAAYDD